VTNLSSIACKAARAEVVLKTLREDVAASIEDRRALFRAEKRCLRLINHPPHPNIVPLLCSYVRGGDCCLVFPRLDMDLSDLFKRATPHGRFRWEFSFFSALHGLASAIERLHNVSVRVAADGLDFEGVGFHHDLRPENVLVSTDTLLLADFGMARVRPRQDGSRTYIRGVAGDYSAPEAMDESWVPLEVGRAVDVWAMGCLAAEIMTYAYLQCHGITRFRRAREAPVGEGNITTSFFHDGGGIKESVRNWINTFATDSQRQPSLDLPLRDLILALLTPATDRPRMSWASRHLGHLSLKAHVFAVLDLLADAIQVSDHAPAQGSTMKMWFELERLRAFGSAIHLSSTSLDETSSTFSHQWGGKCTEILLQMFDVLQSSSCKEEKIAEASAAGNAESADRSKLLELEVQRLVQEIWDILPKAEASRAERAWVSSMLGATTNVNRLNDIEQALRLEVNSMYQEEASRIMIKKIRLQLAAPHNLDLLSGFYEIPIGDISLPDPERDNKAADGHVVGIYGGATPVLMETMYYDQSWEKIPAPERAVVMSRKAQCFNAKPRPPNLRLLECLGFFETGGSGGRCGYSFVYRIPAAKATAPPDVQVQTLLHMLTWCQKSAKTNPQCLPPALGDKFRLAYALASFLTEFHGTGWLHENFHSNNVVYFGGTIPGEEMAPAPAGTAGGRARIYEPYVVGLNKSRPGGDAWHTQGPSADPDFLDYRHPAYERTGRFRVGYDYYSLGMMLLEIGLWSPLSAISKRYPTKSPEELRDLIVQKYVVRLQYLMGAKYQDVVRLLLTDGLDPEPQREPVAESEDRVFLAFVELVVEPLEDLAKAGL